MFTDSQLNTEEGKKEYRDAYTDITNFLKKHL
jgi:virulence-associated protein VapD